MIFCCHVSGILFPGMMCGRASGEVCAVDCSDKVKSKTPKSLALIISQARKRTPVSRMSVVTNRLASSELPPNSANVWPDNVSESTPKILAAIEKVD